LKKEEKLVLKKPVQALVMIPKVGRLTVVARKLYNVILHSAQQQITEFKNLGKEVPATHLFSARLCDLVDPIEASTSNLISLAKIHFKEMVKTEIEWDSPETKKGSVWGVAHLLSEANLTYESAGITNSPLIAQWAFPPSIMKTLIDPELYAQLNIFQIAKLTSYETLVLYEICTRYRSNFDGLTNKNAPEWWVRALSNKLPSIDPQTNAPKFRPWTKFKDDKIKDAVAEINSKTDLDIELIEERVGKKITGVQFRVTRKDTDPTKEPSIVKISRGIAELVVKLGLSLENVTGLVKDGLSEDVLKVGLLKLEARLARQDMTPVDSKMAYLKTVVLDADRYILKSTVPAQKKIPPSTSSTTLSPQEQMRAQIKAELLAMSKDEQKPFSETAMEKISASNMLRPSVSRAFESGEWLKNPQLLSKMVEVYAIATRGLEWLDGPAKEA